MDLNVKSRSYIESICPRGLIGLLSKTLDELWDFFEKLTWKTYAFEQANRSFRYPTHGECDFQANSYPSDHFMNLNDPYYYYMPPILCDYCESSDHDCHTCPFRAYNWCYMWKFWKEDQWLDRSKDRDHENENCCMFSLF